MSLSTAARTVAITATDARSAVSRLRYSFDGVNYSTVSGASTTISVPPSARTVIAVADDSAGNRSLPENLAVPPPADCFTGTVSTRTVSSWGSLDLDSGATRTYPWTGDTTWEDSWDVQGVFNQGTPMLYHNRRVVQGQATQIAFLPGRSFASVTNCDIASATFTTTLANTAFDHSQVALIRTWAGKVYKVGNFREGASM